MTRITFVSYDDEPAIGGQGVELRGMRRALLDRGHAVATVAGRGDHAVPFRRVTGRAPLDLSLQLNRAPRPIRRTAPDVVHALGGPGGVLLVRGVGAPLVYTANHTYRTAHGRASLRRYLSAVEALAYRRAAMVLTISASTADAVRDLGVPARRVEVLAPGVDVPDAPHDQRAGPRLFFAGRWEEEKGVLTAVEVMREVTARFPGASAAVAGAGSLERAVRARAAGADAVNVLGRLDEARLAREYDRASVVLVPSRYEGLGLVALEAQAHGAVVVGYDVPGLRDAVGDRGALVPLGDRAALVAAALDVLRDPARRDDLGARGREHVRAEHSWATVAGRLEEVYAAVVAR